MPCKPYPGYTSCPPSKFLPFQSPSLPQDKKNVLLNRFILKIACLVISQILVPSYISFFENLFKQMHIYLLLTISKVLHSCWNEEMETEGMHKLIREVKGRK